MRRLPHFCQVRTSPSSGIGNRQLAQASQWGLRTGEGDRLFLIEGPNGAYQLTRYDPSFEKKMEKSEEIIGRYRNTLHGLAK